MRGLKYLTPPLFVWKPCRIAHAVRGLKSSSHSYTRISAKSHRSRGAWIEINATMNFSALPIRRIAHAVRGLKSKTI